MYVHALLDVHNKYRAMVANAFSGDSGFMQALDKVVLCTQRYTVTVASFPGEGLGMRLQLLYSCY